MYADVDNGDNTLQKKIRNGEIARYNFILGKYMFRAAFGRYLPQHDSCWARRIGHQVGQFA